MRSIWRIAADFYLINLRKAKIVDEPLPNMLWVAHQAKKLEVADAKLCLLQWNIKT